MGIKELRIEAKFKSKEFRKNPTEAEKKLWHYLRNRKCDNIKFLRQYQIVFNYMGQNHYYICDFYCAEYKTIIEIDGGIHILQKERDKARENILKEIGYSVLRFTNDEVINNIEKVLSEIRLLFK